MPKAVARQVSAHAPSAHFGRPSRLPLRLGRSSLLWGPIRDSKTVWHSQDATTGQEANSLGFIGEFSLLKRLVHSGDDYPECWFKFSSDKHPFQVSVMVKASHKVQQSWLERNSENICRRLQLERKTRSPTSLMLPSGRWRDGGRSLLGRQPTQSGAGQQFSEFSLPAGKIGGPFMPACSRGCTIFDALVGPRET
jgi:hypothetical protein